MANKDKQMTVRSVLAGRVSTYQMLARMYVREIDEEYLSELRKMRCPINTGNADVDEGYRLFHSYLSHIWERTIEDLERDFLTTFIGANTTGHSAAYPNESVHTSSERLIMQDSRDEVMAIYRAAGMVNSESWRAGEDHIAVELEYMTVMAQRSLDASKEGKPKETSRLLLSQYHFLEDHLCAWVPLLAEEMLKFAKTDFYRALAYLTRGFVAEDKAFLAEVLAEELDEERGIEGKQAQESNEASAEAVDEENEAGSKSEAADEGE